MEQEGGEDEKKREERKGNGPHEEDSTTDRRAAGWLDEQRSGKDGRLCAEPARTRDTDHPWICAQRRPMSSGICRNPTEVGRASLAKGVEVQNAKHEAAEA